MRTLMICLIAGSSVLTGCASLTRTPYKTPQVPLPARFEHASTPTSIRADAWWQRFGDPQLDAWVELALARNSDLTSAGIRARRAALQARLAGNVLLPVVNGTASTGTNHLLYGPRTTRDSTTATLAVSWELDLFDRLGAQRDASVLDAQASLQDHDAVALSLIASATSLYWQLGLANERISFAQQSLDYARRTRALVDVQYRSGAVSILERREAEQSLAEQEVLFSQFVQARTDLRQTLTVLFDGARPPGDEPQHLPSSALPMINAGLPAELLRRRPDLRAAELRLRASLASSDAVGARYYPTLSLTGGLGTSSRSLLDVLANPVATLGANMTLPFLNVRETRLSTAVARTQYEEAATLFRKSLYTALTDVERALSARAQLAQQEATQQRALDEAIEIEHLQEVRYRAGQVALRIWLDAQQRRRTAELAKLTTQMAQRQNHLTLHLALGGSVPTT